MITILTTIYNDYDIIDRLLDSLVKQKAKNFMHIIYDDGSKKVNRNKINDYIEKAKKAGQYNQIMFIEGGGNIGVNKAHEYLFKMVKTDYFCWIDADDWVSPFFVEKIDKLIKKHKKVDVFHVNSYRCNEQLIRNSKTTLHKRSRTLLKKDQFRNYCLDDEKFFHHFIIKTKTFRTINPSQTIFESDKNDPFWYDAQILFQLGLSHCVFYMIKKPLSYILDRNNSVSRVVKIEKDYNEHPLIPKIIEYCNISEYDKNLFFLLLPYSKQQKKAYNLLLSNNILEAKDIINKNKQFLKNYRIPKSYKVLEKNIQLVLLHKKYEALFKIRRKIMTLFKPNHQ